MFPLPMIRETGLLYRQKGQLHELVDGILLIFACRYMPVGNVQACCFMRLDHHGYG